MDYLSNSSVVLKMSNLYREYSRILRDDSFRQSHNSSVSYRRKENDLTIEFGVDKKGKHVKKVYNNDESFKKITKTWISNGDVYKSKYVYRQYDTTTKKYKKNGLLHRDNKPAYACNIYKYRPIITYEKWYQNGVLHNPEGFAYFFEEDNTHDDDDPHYYSEERYFWNGEELNEESYYKRRANIKRTELTETLYDCNVVCKDVCGVISSFVW